MKVALKLIILLAIAIISRFIDNDEDYIAWIRAARAFLIRRLSLVLDEVDINTADDYVKGSFYLTVTGASAEAGDDGQVGRGNRADGLLTPYRPMSLEALAGKNPVSHDGKIYNLFALELARNIVEQEMAEAAEVFLVSQIGRPIDEPQLMHIRLKEATAIEKEVSGLAASALKELPQYWKKLAGQKEPV